eukprot:g13473.t1
MMHDKRQGTSSRLRAIERGDVGLVRGWPRCQCSRRATPCTRCKRKCPEHLDAEMRVSKPPLPSGIHNGLLVKLSEVAESSLRLAFGQVGLAVVGTAFEIYEFFKDYNSLGSPQRPSQEKQPDAAVDQKEEPDDSKKCLHGSKLVRQASTWNFYRLCRVLGIVGMLFGELALGLWNYFQNTDVLLEGIQRIELSALQLKPMKDGHACYVRHPDLPPTTPSGVGWPNPILNMVVAGLVVLLFYLIAVAVTWCRRHGKDMGAIR